jgi:hypothetical protein
MIIGMNNPTLSLADPNESSCAHVEGKWQAIRICPDPIAGELFNVGIFFKMRNKTQFRFIDDVRSFECLYGAKSASNLLHLIDIAKVAVSTGDTQNIGRNVLFSSPKFASGDSMDDVVDYLFDSFVTLGKHRNDTIIQFKEDTDSINTNELRHSVFSYIKTKNPILFNDAIRTKPFMITNDSAVDSRESNLAIYKQPSIGNDAVRFGDIVSVHMKSTMHRGFFLNNGVLNIMMANDIASAKGWKSEGGIFLLRPNEETQGFDKQTIIDIDNEIDKTVYHLSKRKNFHVDVFGSQEEVSDAVLNFIQ